MEMEFFVPPAEAEEWYRYWIDARLGWYLRYGLRRSNLRVREHGPEERSHYSQGTSDIEYEYPIGWSELEGVANRGDYDLKRHAEFSGTTLECVGPEGSERYVPWVIEPAVSIERIFVALMVDAYDEEEVAGRERTVLRLHPAIAPVKAAILPLIAKDAGMVDKARALELELRTSHVVEYDEGGAIGRRYRRQDEIGTPFAFTVDEQTLEDDTVTIRDRDSLAQERIAISQVGARARATSCASPGRSPKPRPRLSRYSVTSRRKFSGAPTIASRMWPITKPAIPRCSVSLNAWSKPAFSASSIVFRSQRTSFVPAAGTNESTSSSRVVCSLQAAPFRPLSTKRCTSPSTPPPLNAGFVVHGSASLGVPKWNAPSEISTIRNATAAASRIASRFTRASSGGAPARARAGRTAPRARTTTGTRARASTPAW